MAQDSRILDFNTAAALSGTEFMPVVQSGETRKVTVSNLLANSTSVFKGTWSNTVAYLAGSYVYYQNMPWYAVNNNTNSTPGVNSDWLILGVYEVAYGPSWATRTPPSAQVIYQKIQSLDSLYLRLDGTSHMLGNLDMNTFNITNGGIITALHGLSTDGTASIFSDTANDRVYLGQSAGLANSGNNVFFSLIGAGYGNTGSSSIGIGYYALSSNSADSNFGLGNYSLQYNTGGNNFAAGVYSGNGNTGGYCNFFGYFSGQGNSGNHCYFAGYQSGLSNIPDQVKALGQDSAHSNTFSNIFTVSKITDVFWNNVGDQGFATLQNVNVQTAMSLNGINQSAASSIQSFASSRGTGSGLPGNLQWMYSPPLASGTTRQTLSLAATMDGSTGNFTFAKNIFAANLTLAGSFSSTATAMTTFTVTIGSTLSNNTYVVTASAKNALSAALFYITNQTTTTFDVVFLTAITGAVSFGWHLKP